MNPNRCPKMYLMVGLPRSGKSTWINANKKNLNAIVLSNDWVRENILHAEHSKSNDPAIWMLVDGCARILLSQKQNVIIDGIHLTKSIRKFFIQMARECGANVVIVWIDTPLQECLRRNQFDHKLPDETLHKMYEEMETPQPSEYDRLIYEKYYDIVVGHGHVIRTQAGAVNEVASA